MDMMPPPSFWDAPAEIRRVDDCVREHPCVTNSKGYADERDSHDHPEPARYRIEANAAS